MTAFPVMPGVPAAGHVTRQGWWHPGAAQSCHRPPCEDHRMPPRHDFPQGGHGECYCPWCAATLLTIGTDEQRARDGHIREAGHEGRPRMVNTALRLARVSRSGMDDT